MAHRPFFRGNASKQNDLEKEVLALRGEVQRLWKRMPQTPQEWEGSVLGGIGNPGGGGGLGSGSGSGSGYKSARLISNVVCSGSGLILTYVTITGTFTVT
jgi:hypothetical protein